MTNGAVKTINLTIGQVFTSTSNVIVDATISSSDLGVCLFIPGTSSAGIVLFSKPIAAGQVEKSVQYTYGNIAIPALIKDLQKLTSQPAQTFSAKLFGGSKGVSARGSAFDIGEQNIRMAKQILNDFNIRVVGEDIGGELDRRALFHTGGGRLQVAPIETSISTMKPKEHSSAPEERKRKVLIVDDSKTIRDLLVRILSEDGQLEIIGTAENPIQAQLMLKTLKPDVITLDIHMPEMTGVEWLEKQYPKLTIPVVMITSLQLQDGNEVFKALELGAVDYIQKPILSEIKELAPIIREKVKAASFAKVKNNGRNKTVATCQIPLGTMDPHVLIAMGASTGGTEALKDVLMKLPKDIPPILIVQHIPAVFSKAFADRLNAICPFEVLEAQDGDEVKPGRVLIAAGATQMAIEKTKQGNYIVRVKDDAPMNRHKPSVDYLFNSVAEVVGSKSIGVILTGMGADGAQGLLKMRNAGAKTIGQDEDSCVVYGMPRAAFLVGAIEEVCPLEEVALTIAKKSSKKKLVA